MNLLNVDSLKLYQFRGRLDLTVLSARSLVFGIVRLTQLLFVLYVLRSSLFFDALHLENTGPV
jgi:hypothetical protein